MDLLDSVSIIKNNIPSGIYSGTLLNEIFRSMLFNGSFFQHGISSYVWSKLFKQKILFENQMHVADDVFIGEDSACVYPSLLKTERLCIIDDAQYHYRQRADSMLKTVGKPETEINNLDILYQNMKESFRDSKYKVIMMPQLKYFILNLLIIRSGGIWTENGGKTYSHIFSDMRKDSRVIIYSAGTFGQLLVKKISSTGYAKIIAWIDPDYRQYCECGLDIKPLEAVNGSQYDYLIIASTDADVVRQAQKHFIGLGVPEFKIATIDCKLGKAEKLLKASGFYNI